MAFHSFRTLEGHFPRNTLRRDAELATSQLCEHGVGKPRHYRGSWAGSGVFPSLNPFLGEGGLRLARALPARQPMAGVGLGATEQLGVSSIYVPAEKVVLHEHVLNTLLQWLLLLLCTEQPQSCTGTTLEPHRSLQPRLHLSPPGKGNARDQPSHTHTYLSLSRKLPVLGEAEGKAAEDTRDQGTVSGHSGLFCPPTSLQSHQVPGPSELPTHPPELTLDLDPAGAAQEGPGLVPLLHSGQAGTEDLQPQV